ncbi:amidase domain-containing protein [Peptoniphilus sp. SGI.035]|uniref:amidase domain-containing protein n=1 Tax=Peptoniphilus sp. SGI.035 TaxID=3420564 RepID=UPI003D03D246
MRTYQDDWFEGFNPNYANFEGYGEDCTNYASQVLYSGCKTMYAKRGSRIAGSNYWFYRS